MISLLKRGKIMNSKGELSSTFVDKAYLAAGIDLLDLKCGACGAKIEKRVEYYCDGLPMCSQACAAAYKTQTK